MAKKVVSTAVKNLVEPLTVAPATEASVAAARKSGAPLEVAKVLHSLAVTRGGGRAEELAGQLFAGLSTQQVAAVRAAYVKRYGMDPEHHIKSDDWAQPLRRLERPVETKLLGALNGAELEKTAGTLATLLESAEAGKLTPADRATYFGMLPMLGLWNRPMRATAKTGNLDSQERALLSQAFAEKKPGVRLDDALKRIEAGMPAADLSPRAPREKSIAAIASSSGAQWQELMGWAQKMLDQGYHVQVFTPEGRPVSMQRDSLLVSSHTSGFGSPPSLDPAGRTGEMARSLLGNTAPAAKFDPKNFGAVYLAGGLGFNEDVAVATANGKGTTLTANPHIEAMMNRAVAERLPIIGLCHGPTLLAALDIEVGGKKERLNKGIETASLPPFEGYVGFTGRKEIQFTYDVNTHESLEATGGRTSVVKDIADMARVVKAHKDGMDIITGPGPLAASNLADATVDALKRKWR